MALNAKTENSDDGSERQNWEAMMALNAKTENSDDGSERQNWEVIALNAKTKKRWWLWTPNWEVMTALNAKLKSNDGSDCQTEKIIALEAK